MSRAPLDYYTAHPPTREFHPRISKLAISSFTFSLITGMLMCGPIPPMVERMFSNAVEPFALLSIPTAGLLLSVTALLRILNALDELKGEGIAIAGMITSIVTGLIVVMMVAAP
jgi:hypothetical protein